MTVRIAVIGTGVMGKDHARIFAEDIPGAKLQVVCDISEEAARNVADSYSVEHFATDAVAVVERDDVDAIVIASPDETHADLTLAAIELHKPVLCEKPLAKTPEECLQIVEAECGLGRQLVQVGFMRRFDPGYAAMKQALTSGQIGSAVMMHNFHRNVVAPPHFNGMMAITNSAPHEFDIIRYVLDAEITSIIAYEPKAETGGACKPVVMVLESSQGQLMTVEVNNDAAYGYDVRGELVGSTGSVYMGEPEQVRIDKNFTASAGYAEDWRPRYAEAYRLQNKAWIQSIISGVPNLIASNAWDGYCATVIAETGAATLASGVRAVVELAEKPPLYQGATT